MIGSVVGLVGIVLSLVSVVLTVYYYLKSKEAKEPCCYYRTFQDIVKLSPKSSPDIRVYFKGDEVERVFTTYVWFWNKGKRAIKSDAIPENSLLLLKLSDPAHDIQILDLKVMKRSRDPINFDAQKYDSDLIHLTFDFLDRKDGAVIEVQHTGSYETQITVEGIILESSDIQIFENNHYTVNGVQKIRKSRSFKKRVFDTFFDPRTNYGQLITLTITLMLVFCILVGLYQMENIILQIHGQGSWLNIYQDTSSLFLFNTGLSAVIATLLFVIYTRWVMAKPYPKSLFLDIMSKRISSSLTI